MTVKQLAALVKRHGITWTDAAVLWAIQHLSDDSGQRTTASAAKICELACVPVRSYWRSRKVLIELSLIADEEPNPGRPTATRIASDLCQIGTPTGAAGKGKRSPNQCQSGTGTRAKMAQVPSTQKRSRTRAKMAQVTEPEAAPQAESALREEEQTCANMAQVPVPIWHTKDAENADPCQNGTGSPQTRANLAQVPVPKWHRSADSASKQVCDQRMLTATLEETVANAAVAATSCPRSDSDESDLVQDIDTTAGLRQKVTPLTLPPFVSHLEGSKLYRFDLGQDPGEHASGVQELLAQIAERRTAGLLRPGDVATYAALRCAMAGSVATVDYRKHAALVTTQATHVGSLDSLYDALSSVPHDQHWPFDRGLAVVLSISAIDSIISQRRRTRPSRDGHADTPIVELGVYRRPSADAVDTPAAAS